ncbi:isocitrate/isopropylmalate family dehydrogenase [Nisaea acidiphila]|uniref:3-isopropylmalate dehydrogenase n=1 Tax=Nisaea acidiphila TaxID=1862145 RepID=A0A9J7AZ05_9PROT|nr:isocitrate/isopropylmalate family dehydrogenase [Nisaea acidiphila]UUX50669.1 isocitrate/isopropylmalate family dehydrogenase [Nisaea acidiphila]
MKSNRVYRIALFDGDGIGPEIMAPTRQLLEDVSKRIGRKLEFESLPAGAQHFARTGEALPADSIAAARDADAILLSAMGLPDIRKEDGTEITPQIDIRFALGLYAGVRPVKLFPGQPTPLADKRIFNTDFVLIRESTEGLFAHMHEGQVVDNEYATETLRITRGTSEKLFDFAFRLAARRAEKLGRPGRVTCVDKANVFRAFWFFRSIFEERAKAFQNISADCAYVDAFAMWMVQRPWEFDVVVTENMFGDILSDLGAGIMGTLGLAPSADIGDSHAVFQPCHGSAPDIAGKGLANPLAMFLSASMMLDWLAGEHEDPALAEGAQMIDAAVAAMLDEGSLLTRDLGGTAGTEELSNAVLRRTAA